MIDLRSSLAGLGWRRFAGGLMVLQGGLIALQGGLIEVVQGPRASANVPPPVHKRDFIDTWYQRLSDTGSYNSWMTLTAHRHLFVDDSDQ